MRQLELLPGRQLDLLTEDDEIQARFVRFHKRNPVVYHMLCRVARTELHRGKRKLGIGDLWERLRWDSFPEVTSDESFRLSNDFRSRYARLIMMNEPDLRGVFELRGLRTTERKRVTA